MNTNGMRTWQADRVWVAGLAGVVLVFYLLTTAGYGYFRDELYYLACAEHLAFGYVDQPPLIALIAWLVRHVLGESLFALRLLPGAAAAATVYLTGRMASQLGGGRFAAILAAVCAALAPAYLVLFSILTMNAFDVLIWTAIVAIAIDILKGSSERSWLAIGLLAGIGLENKISVLFLGFGLVVGLVAARQWRRFRSPWLWAGGATALVLFAPHLIWQALHDWPTIEFMVRKMHGIAPLSPLGFLLQQMILMQPLALPIWVAGLAFFLLASGGRPYRALGWVYLAVLALMITQRAKPYYLSPAYPMLYAAGALVLERATNAARGRWLRPAIVALIVVSGALLAPLVKALLPVETYVAYHDWLGIATESGERNRTGRLWQIFADQLGWPEMVATVADVHRQLPPADRERACLFASNWGEAGAIDFFGPALGLPKAGSGHNSYFLWGPPPCDGNVAIVVGDRREDLERFFASVTLAATFRCRDCMPYEGQLPIWVCRGLRGGPLAEVWPAVKHYD